MANVCTLVGYTWEDQDVFSGIGGEAYGDEGFELYYQGGVHISGGTFSSNGGAFNAVAKHTIDQHYLHTAESIIVSLVKFIHGLWDLDHRNYSTYKEIVDTSNERHCHGRMPCFL